MRIAKIALLALFVASTLIVSTGTASASAPCTTIGRFQDDNPNGSSPDVDFVYEGNWTHEYDTRDGTIDFTESYTLPYGHPFWPETISFTLYCAKEFQIFYAKADNRGMMEVYVNGVYKTTIDQYSPSVVWQASTRVRLSPGTNNIVLKRIGSKNPSSDAYYVGFDAVRVLSSWGS